MKALSRKKVYSREGEFTPGRTGDGKVGVMAGSGDVLPSIPRRKALAGVTLPDPAHAPELDGFTHETGCKKPSPSTGVETWSIPRVLA